MNAIGIDMSKDTFHASFDDRFVSRFMNTEAGIDEFLGELRQWEITRSDTTIGVEATGAYHLLFASRLTARNWRVVVMNPIESHRMIAQGLRKVKTDRTDAVAIRKAVMAGMGHSFTDTPEILALKALVVERAAFVQLRATTKQRKHVHELKQRAAGLPLHDGGSALLSTLNDEIKVIERMMEQYATDTQELLRSIPGIGKTSAAALVAFIGDIHRFSKPEKLVAYIGLDCRVHESGTSIHGKGYLTKRGNKYLRHVLFSATFIARRRNPALKDYFTKKVREGKHYFSAMCAVERKLVHLIYAVWKRGTPFAARTP